MFLNQFIFFNVSSLLLNLFKITWCLVHRIPNFASLIHHYFFFDKQFFSKLTYLLFWSLPKIHIVSNRYFLRLLYNLCSLKHSFLVRIFIHSLPYFPGFIVLFICNDSKLFFRINLSAQHFFFFLIFQKVLKIKININITFF